MEIKKKCRYGEKFPHLFSPIRIGNIRMKNRIICAPTSPSMIDLNGHFTPEMIAYLEEKAKGGAGVVTYGEAIVHSATGKSHNKQLQLDAFGVRQGMTEAARASTMQVLMRIYSFLMGACTVAWPVWVAMWTPVRWPTGPAICRCRPERYRRCQES